MFLAIVAVPINQAHGDCTPGEVVALVMLVSNRGRFHVRCQDVWGNYILYSAFCSRVLCHVCVHANYHISLPSVHFIAFQCFCDLHPTGVMQLTPDRATFRT